MILITGASGKTGKALLARLVAAGQDVRVFVRHIDQGEKALLDGARDVFCGDLTLDDDLQRACRNVAAVYHICPNMYPAERQLGERLIKAALSQGVAHFVYHSVLHPHVEEMPHHWNKLRVEEYLFRSGLPFTILQPAAYMQNVLAYWRQICNDGLYPVPYALETRLGMVDLEDVAEAASVVLTQAGHLGAIYELAGGEALTQLEVAQTLSKIIGKPVRAQGIDRDEWERRMLTAGMTLYEASTLKKMFVYYEKFGFYGNPNVIRWLIGREQTSFEAFLQRVTSPNTSPSPAF